MILHIMSVLEILKELETILLSFVINHYAWIIIIMQDIRVFDHYVNIGSPERPATGGQNWRIASRLFGCSCMTIGLVQALHYRITIRFFSWCTTTWVQSRSQQEVLKWSKSDRTLQFSTSVEHRVKMLVGLSQKVMILPTLGFSKFLAGW